MRQIKTLFIAAIFILGASQTINAQAKTAHVDVSEIMTKMPAMLDAQKQLDKLSTTYDADYKKMVEEYQGKLISGNPLRVSNRLCHDDGQGANAAGLEFLLPVLVRTRYDALIVRERCPT